MKSKRKSGSTKKAPSSNDETNALRKKQIDSLRQRFATLQVISPDTVYDIPIQLINGQTLTLRTTLNPQFPHQPPVVQIIQPAKHRFLDPNGFVVPQAHEKLAQWSAHTSLGKTIYELVQTFMQEPPQLLSLNAGRVQPLPGAAIPVMGSLIAPPSSGGFTAPTGMTASPLSGMGSSLGGMPPQIPTSVPAFFPEVENLSPNQINSLLQNEQEFQIFFENLESVRALNASRGQFRDQNERLATQNLSNEKQLNDIKRETSALQRAVSEKRVTFDQKAQRQQQVMAQFTTVALVDKLKQAAGEAERESDEISNKFLSGQLPAQEFVRQFMAKRKLHHLRAAKCEYLVVHNPQVKK